MTTIADAVVWGVTQVSKTNEGTDNSINNTTNGSKRDTAEVGSIGSFIAKQCNLKKSKK